MAQNLRMPEPEPRPDGPTIDPIPDPSLPEPPPGTWPITTPIEDPPVRPIDTVAVQRLRQDLPPQKRQGPPTSDVLTDPQKRGATGRDKPDVRQSDITDSDMPPPEEREEAAHTTRIDP